MKTTALFATLALLLTAAPAEGAKGDGFVDCWLEPRAGTGSTWMVLVDGSWQAAVCADEAAYCYFVATLEAVSFAPDQPLLNTKYLNDCLTWTTTTGAEAPSCFSMLGCTGNLSPVVRMNEDAWVVGASHNNGLGGGTYLVWNDSGIFVVYKQGITACYYGVTFDLSPSNECYY